MVAPVRLTLIVTTLAVATLALVACGQSQRVGSAGGPVPSKSHAKAALQALHTQANQLLGGGTAAFAARMASLRGTPVVVNQWASWCGPCRFEFPFFQRLSRRYDGRVAFLGVDAQDARSDAAAFLKKFPVPYPHFYDQNASIARTFGGGRSWPTTAFFAASGKLAFSHVGGYATQTKLNDDIVRYALHG